MPKKALILFFVLGVLLTISIVRAPAWRGTPPHDVEKFIFESGCFHVVGELRILSGEGRHPLVIMVHGDGPAYKNSFLLLKRCFLRAGYATLIWDKPGFGQSTGELSRQRLRAERAEILLGAIDRAKSHPRIDSRRIGVWGISQAGYVIPLALAKTDDIAFMIMVGCPGENGIRQTAYLIRRQLQFEGVSERQAKKAEDHFIQLYYAETFEQYIQHAKPLVDNPVQRKLGFVSALWDETDWKPHSLEDEGFLDPIPIIEKVTIPVLAFFGEKDTQVDPIQGVDAYKKALTKAGNKNFRVELIPDADHGIIISQTGSLKERERRSAREWQNYAPEYLAIMEDWLRRLSVKPQQF
jgi:pimeloyl-ACP methyl ester carboxylesterase